MKYITLPLRFMFILSFFMISLVMLNCSNNPDDSISLEEDNTDNPDTNFQFPDEQNTGSRIPETNLTDADGVFEKKYDSYQEVDYYTIKEPGMYSGFHFKNYITIESDDVTLEDCIIEGSVNVRNQAKNTRIEYTEIRGKNAMTGEHNIGIGFVCKDAGSMPVIYRSFIHSFFDLTRPGPAGIEITESYLYDWGNPTDGNHADALQYPVWDSDLAPTENTKIIIRRNSIIEPFNDNYTAAIGFNSVTKHWIIENNYFQGAGFMMYISEGGYILKNNIFAGDYLYGDFRYFGDSSRNYGTWEGNKDQDGNEIIPPEIN